MQIELCKELLTLFPAKSGLHHVYSPSEAIRCVQLI